MKIDKSNPRHWLLLGLQLAYTLVAAIGRAVSPKPEKPLVVLYGHQLSGNLKALYDRWHERFTDKFDCYFLSLDPEYSAELRKQGVNVLQCNQLKDMLLVGRSDAIITDHGLHLMSPLLSLTSIKFIDVWHGIPFKGFVPDDFRLQHRYHEVWVSSPLLKSIYEDQFGFSPKKVISIGYARSDKLFRGDAAAISYRRQASITEQRRLVLYAPTWQQNHQGHELFPFGEVQESFIEAVSTVCAKHSATLVVRSHLNARINESISDNALFCPMRTFPDTEGLLQDTDILICDWSSIAFDYLALDRPAIFLDVKSPYRNGFSLGPEHRFGDVAHNMSDLLHQLAAILLDHTDYWDRKGDLHTDITNQVYGVNTDGHVASRQLDRLVKMITRRAP